MAVLATGKLEKTKTSTILQRISEKHKTVVTDCVNTYGNFIWALAQKFTASNEEAEAARRRRFLLTSGDTRVAPTNRRLPKNCSLH